MCRTPGLLRILHRRLPTANACFYYRGLAQREFSNYSDSQINLMASFWWIEGRLLFSQVVMIRTHNMLILLLMSIQMNFFVRLSHLSIRHFLLVFMSPAWQYLTMNVHCGLSRSSLLLGSARSCGSAGSAMLRCLVGCGSKMDFY